MYYVITGGAGFIGSHLARALAENHEVTVLDDLSTGRMENISDLQLRFIRGSVTSLPLLRRTFSGADGIFHLAAVASVPRSVEHPLATNKINLSGTLNVLEAARGCGVKKVVFASSSAVYGNTNTIPLNEEMPPRPQSPYAISKLAGEYYCRVFSDLFNVKTVSLRYFNVFGPGQNPHSRYAAVIPRFIMRILKHKPPVIFGDGMQTRDFIYVNDAVQANLRAMEGTATGVFNIGCGRRVNLITLASAVMEVCGTDLRIQFEDARPGEVRDSCADISRAGDGLGFVPEYTLAEGLKETTAWYRKRYSLH